MKHPPPSLYKVNREYDNKRAIWAGVVLGGAIVYNVGEVIIIWVISAMV